MKKILSVAALSFLWVSFASAAVSYNRSPSGTEITSPITISVSADSFVDDFECPNDSNFWWIVVESFDGDEGVSSAFSSSTLSVSSIIFLPNKEMTAVRVSCGYTDDFTPAFGTINLEGDGSYTIFTIISSPLSNLAANINAINKSSFDFIVVLLNHYWPFVLGFLILVAVISFGKKAVQTLFR